MSLVSMKWLVPICVLQTLPCPWAQAMNYQFEPLGKSNKVEIGLTTGFAGGEVRGAFPKVGGSLRLDFENLANASGKVLLDARSLRFGHQKVSGDVHSIEWLDSASFPEITFTLEGLHNPRWKGKTLLANAKGPLKLKNRKVELLIPLTIRHFRGERRKMDGKSGDLIVLAGESSISRSKFGINPGSMLDSVMDKVTVKINLVGGSDRIRPFLPSDLFRR